jgi:hypothetical protein
MTSTMSVTGSEKKPSRIPAMGQSEIARRYAVAKVMASNPSVKALQALVDACRALEVAAREELKARGGR